MEVGSPEWWVARLWAQLTAERPQIDRFREWYDGEQPLPSVRPECSAAYKWFLEMSRNNFAALIIDAAADRLMVDGFTFTDQTPSAVDPWRDIWQANDLDVESMDAQREALTVGRCPVSVGLTENGTVRVAVEDPAEMICGYLPGALAPAAALKVFLDRDTRHVAELMLPGRIIRWVGPTSERAVWGKEMVARLVTGEPAFDGPGAASVPVRELRPRRRAGATCGMSDLAGIEGSLRRMDKLTVDKLVAAEFGAHRQRWVSGLELDRDDDGNPVQPFRPGADRMFLAEDAGARFGEFAHTPLDNFDAATAAEIERAAAISRTPPYYLLGRMINLSADAIRAAEAGLVTRVERHQRAFGETWEGVMRVALDLLGDPRANDVALSTVWKSAETRTRAELADALTKAVAGFGLPQEVAWVEWGASPQDVAAWRQMAATSALLGVTGRDAPA